jgi:hypothetical protein
MTRNARTSSFSATAIVLIAVKLGLATIGFRRSLRVLGKLTAGVSSAPAIGDARDERLVDETVRRIATAAAFFPGRALCLEQSLALYYCLRRAGVAAELRMGVRHTPFTAHAWVELEGRPLHEQRDHLNQLVPLEGSFL